jgi:hypothetical protein
MKFKKQFILFTTLVMMAIITPLTLAEEEAKTDGLAHAILITAKDGHGQALEDAMAKYHSYVADKKGSWRYTWYQIITGPNTGKYIARSGNHNWADFDVEHDWDKAADENFAANVLPHIANSQASITRTVPDLGIWPESMEGYKYIQLTTWHIKSGQNTAFNKGLKKIDGILKSNGWPNYYTFINNESGGHGNTILLASPSKSYADMAPKELKFMNIMSKVMGEDEAKAFMANWGTTYKTGDYYMVEYLPKASKY